jgi:hypothetical protein
MPEPLLEALKLIRVEADRANELFPHDETEAVSELLRRSHQFPNLKKGMLVMCAIRVIEEARRSGNEEAI